MSVQARVPSHLTAEQLLAQIPPDLRASFDADYRNLLAANNVHTDAQELAMIRALLQDAEDGIFWLNGQQIRVNPSAVPSPASRASIRSQVAGGEEVDRKKNAIRWGLFIVVGVAAVLVLSGILSHGGEGRTAAPNTSSVTAAGDGGPITAPAPVKTSLPAMTMAGGAVVTVTPLPVTFAPPTDLPPATPPNVESIFDGVKVKVGIFYPKTMEIGGQGFYLVPTNVSPTAGWWIPQGEGAASWVNGSSVNYVIGLPYTERNAAIMSAVQVGDPIRIRMSTGQVLDFTVREKVRVLPQQVELFRQKRPSVTVALTGDPLPTRLVVVGEYNSATEITGGYAGSLWGITPSKVWEPAAAGELAVRIAAAQYYTPTNALVRGFLPAGQALYVLNLVLSNAGTVPIPLNAVQAEVVDRGGIRYPSMVAVAKRYGQVKITLTDVAARELAAGETISLSAAYMVPVTLTTDLTFVVTGPAGDRALFDLTPTALVPPPTPTPTPTPIPTVAPAATATPAPAVAVEVAAAVILDQAPGAAPTHGLFLALSLTMTNLADMPVQLQWADFALNCVGTEPGCAGTVYPPANLYEVNGRLVNALPATIPGRSRLGLVLVFDVADVPEVKLTARGQEFFIRLK